jgi:hypothetical protein
MCITVVWEVLTPPFWERIAPPRPGNPDDFGAEKGGEPSGRGDGHGHR